MVQNTGKQRLVMQAEVFLGFKQEEKFKTQRSQISCLSGKNSVS
jgi:hypothetical protein